MLSRRLREQREQKKMTQEELGRIFGVDRATISRYETGDREPDYELVKKFADFFGVTTDYLLGRTDIRTPLDSESNTDAAAKIVAALQNNPELLDFWTEISRREDLQLMFKQVRDLSPETIRKLVRVIKAIEDEESE